MRVRSDQVMTITEAKRLLGVEALEMSDEDIQNLIEDFDMIAQYTIKMVQSFDNK
jgi:Asp-tRNA(Asn)/Glu-tRNA(Gln) amidotransferase C subunit